MKKILILGLVLALALALAMPTAAMASAPPSSSPDCVPGKTATTFLATGLPTSIDEGKVKPLGDSGKWLVKDRHLKGTFIPGSGISGNFCLTYGGIFKISDQSGNLVGTLTAGKVTCAVVGETQPVVPIDNPYADSTSPTGYVLPCLMQASGHWTGVKNLKANGDFNAYIVLAVQFDVTTMTTGHVNAVLSSYDSPAAGPITSAFIMTGKYTGKR